MTGGWAAPNNSSKADPGSRRQSLKGCMGAFPHMFQWSRTLGSNNRCIAPTADIAKTLPGATSDQQKQTQSKRWAYSSKQFQAMQHLICGLEYQLGAGKVPALAPYPSVSGISGLSESVSDRNATLRETHQTACMDLRQVLHAKQEPFVLQDVIRQKKQPTRTHSSRELKYSGAPAAARRSSRDFKSQDEAYQNEVCAAAQCRSQHGVRPKVPTRSAAVVSRKAPVESMVALPAKYQAAPAVCGEASSAKRAHGKPAASTQGRSPVKSPNKRALLMEAAARILEGSNRRTNHPKRSPSSSVRSLLEELEKSKKTKDQFTDKENQVVIAPEVQLSEASDGLGHKQGVPYSAETATESLQEHQKWCDGTWSGKTDSINFSRDFHHFESTALQQVLDEVDLLVLHDRVSPCNSSAGKEVEVPSSQLATSVTDMGRFKFDASGSSLLQVGRSSSTDLAEDSKAIVVPSSSRDPSVDFSASMLHHTCLRPVTFGNSTSSLIRVVLDDSVGRHVMTWGCLHRAAPFAVNYPQENDLSSARNTLIECGTAAETGYTNVDQTRDRTHMESDRKNGVMKLRLCNYSWWAHNSPQNTHSSDHLAQLKSVELYSCDGYSSPLPSSRRSSFCKKAWDSEVRDGNCSEEEVRECVQDEFEQASPVSVLEPVQYEEEEEEEEEEEKEELVDGSSVCFDNFEEARQKLLEKVSRYEMLARMDVATLRKVSDEQASDACTREVYYHEEDNEWWETDSRSSSSSCCFQGAASPAPDFPTSDDDESEEFRNSLSAAADRWSWRVECSETRPLNTSLNCSTTRSESIRPSNCRVDLQVGEAPLQCSDEGLTLRGEDSRSTEVEKRLTARFSSSSMARSVPGNRVIAKEVTSLLRTDLTKSYTDWSSSSRCVELQEEEGVVQLALESCFFDILLGELLCELLELAPEQLTTQFLHFNQDLGGSAAPAPAP